jgi:hypothetical protein
MLAKLFLTVEALEERQLICFSKRDRARTKECFDNNWIAAQLPMLTGNKPPKPLVAILL